MAKKKEMTPPPPSKIVSSVSTVSDELEDFQFFPTRSSPPSTSSLLKSQMSTSTSISNSNSGLNSSSGSNSNSYSSMFSDDFTLGLRVGNSQNQSSSTNHIKKQQEQQQTNSHHNQNHHHHYNNHRRASHPSNHYNRPTNSKERYVFSKFLVKEGSIVPKSADEPFDWLSIEMVLVPEIENVLCPICLDVPCTPRFTRCGHIYCLPCLLQYFQTSEASPAGLGNNWRTCPVCAEPLHLKQLRCVKFCPATEPKEGETFHSILIQKPVGSLQPKQPTFPNSCLSSISPFQRLIPISRTFVLNEIMTPELVYLRNELKKRKLFGEESLELSFHEAAIKLIEDQRKVLLENSNETASASQIIKEPTESYYYHQSRDGLNVFLHPLCMKILKHHFNTYDSIPSELSLPIIQLERVLVNSSNRRRFKYLDHLSLGTQIILVEVDLRSIVSAEALQSHQRELLHRKDARDQKLASDSLNNNRNERSILDEWKRMEDDYYSTAQAASAMDIRVPESVKLDNLDDEASFPLPSSYNANSTPPILVQKKISPVMTAGSPSFSSLAHSLNSPFAFNPNFSNDTTWVTSPVISTKSSWGPPQKQKEDITSTNTINSKKKIVLFSSGLNLNSSNNNKKN